MKILFVSSGNHKYGINPIIKTQGDSLNNDEYTIEYFTIIGKGFKGYLKNILLLHKFLRNCEINLIHAHYSFSGYVASLASNLPVITSLMGSDIQANKFWCFLIKFFSSFIWKKTIVKSKSMKNKINNRNAIILPNGVDFNVFKPLDKMSCKKKVGFNDKKHILFVANPNRKAKNFKLAEKVIKKLDNINYELNVIYNIEHDEVATYMNAADVLLLTSLWEGSPNVIKEAMACNLPIVSTDVGDVKEVIYEANDCYLTDFNPDDICKKIQLVTKKDSRTNGRNKIKHLELQVIADKLLEIYNSI